jgi:very-short-patch-repair endonuclease
LLSYYSNPQVTTTEVEDTDIVSLKRRLEASSSTSGSPPKPFDSWFEVDVFLRIVARGYRVLPQFHINGYYIDLVVEGMRGRLAVECDGDAWHGPDRHDEDSARQRDLERCGMQFWRVRGSVFYFDKEKAMEGLWERLEQLKIFATAAESAEQQGKSAE